ncbi:hypothetical protein [Terrihalobacillus insolitus]|uniref:hypothetical protein n=1 Tax=Terrihalobacillus insolitus TaxID=2950438 RepID=UPI0023413705|nr:hypothetical protein [Terrihalobacillus insolitus]MDC3413211.1 hypothetical protein [Terrihalobacillus insolitus]
MLKNKNIIVAFLATALILVLAACGQADESAAKEDDTTTASQDTDANEEENATEDQEEDEASEEEIDYGAVYKEGLDELAKEEVDFDKLISIYDEKLQPFVQNRDSDKDNLDQTITAALEAGKSGDMDPAVVKQLFDKLMQKVFFLTIRAEFAEVTEAWDDKEVVNEEIEEAKEFYELIKGTVEKRDAAYSTTLVDKIDAGFTQMEEAVTNDDSLAFQLGKQVVDKTLMKTFYLATGALPNGYATKIAANEDVNEAKVQQAEGWAFYQSLAGYLTGNSPEEAELIEQQFNLETDVKGVNPETVNLAFVRGWAQTALNEFEESEENLGEDEAVITALEGALFIDMIDSDLKRIVGEDGYSTLNDQAQSYLEAVQADEQDKALELNEQIVETLTNVVETAK